MAPYQFGLQRIFPIQFTLTAKTFFHVVFLHRFFPPTISFGLFNLSYLGFYILFVAFFFFLHHLNRETLKINKNFLFFFFFLMLQTLFTELNVFCFDFFKFCSLLGYAFTQLLISALKPKLLSFIVTISEMEKHQTV